MKASSASVARHAGLLVPLFSIPSEKSWGIGEIGDIPPMAAWLRGAGQDILQLLPINEMPPGERSPYSALSAMAIDPQFISLRAVEDFLATGGEHSLDTSSQQALASARASRTVNYQALRPLKAWALRTAFAHFREHAWRPWTARAAALSEFIADQSWWLEDYSLFRAIRARLEKPWTEWDAPLRTRDAGALQKARQTFADEILFCQYVQWLADAQWQEARRAAAGVRLFGDFPFVVATDSADVWARQHEFRLDASVGVPPDAFSEAGQDWGLPVYRWDVMHENGYQWLSNRARRSAALYDGYRVDHLVGFYRTYVRPHDGGRNHFTPSDQEAQLAQGERLMSLFLGSGARIIAEDLGLIPEFVRRSLERLELPGYRVLRWERLWKEDGQPFVDPVEYPTRTVATSGTHDTEPLAVWWDSAPAEERRQAAELPGLAHLARSGVDVANGPFTMEIRDALLDALFSAGSDLLIIPIQDVFGWRDRINEPATVGDANWAYRLPWAVNRLDEQPEARDRAAALRGWSERYGRVALNEQALTRTTR